MFLRAARLFLRERFGEVAQDFTERVGDDGLVKEISDCLWQELLQPFADAADGSRQSMLKQTPEGEMVCNRTKRYDAV